MLERAKHREPNTYTLALAQTHIFIAGKAKPRKKSKLLCMCFTPSHHCNGQTANSQQAV